MIGLDIHRSFEQVAILENGAITAEHRLELTREKLTVIAGGLHPDDEALLEATGNTAAVVRLLEPHVGRVVVTNPLQLRAIAHARVKTDKVDTAMLARSKRKPIPTFHDFDVNAETADLIRSESQDDGRGLIRGA